MRIRGITGTEGWDVGRRGTIGLTNCVEGTMGTVILGETGLGTFGEEIVGITLDPDIMGLPKVPCTCDGKDCGLYIL